MRHSESDLTDLFPLNVDLVNFSISNASVLFFI